METKYVEKLADLAGRLDEAGLTAHADRIDQVLRTAAQSQERQYDIHAQYKVAVHPQAYAQHMEPPANTHLRADCVLTVKPVRNGQIVEQEVLFNQAFAAKNLDEVRKQVAPVRTQLQSKFVPASVDETIEYYPAPTKK